MNKIINQKKNNILFQYKNKHKKLEDLNIQNKNIKIKND